MLPDCSDPKSECPDFQIRLPRHKWPKSWANIEDLVVLLERNLYGHPSAGLVWERRFEEVLLELGWEKVQNWECLFVRRKQGLFLSVYVDDTKNGWKVAECGSHVEEIDEKNVDLDEPTSFLGYVHFGMQFNVNAIRTKPLLTSADKCLNPVFLL